VTNFHSKKIYRRKCIPDPVRVGQSPLLALSRVIRNIPYARRPQPTYRLPTAILLPRIPFEFCFILTSAG